ncbi:hypothetical protein [Chroococcidiopsis sp. CCMEE 29]|uniref:hypothetical protein n=1 Tax=Chroococcidiopsis sp. CCMEE 29 TaxID=155894 RepID=UPI0020200259|nr:hypothetical protein [Chroococcidiopsis sp. CCMEE 29]
MARPDQEKCRLCSKLTSQEAQQRHGPNEDGCWDAKYCHNRRSYYRHRGVRNHVRKQRRQVQQAEPLSSEPEVSRAARVATLEVLAPAVPAAIAHFYRQTKDSPLHALGAELWMGNDRIAKIEPVHCLGLTEMQVKNLLVRILDGFSQYSGMKVERFRSSVELNPLNCPIYPCPLHPSETNYGS